MQELAEKHMNVNGVLKRALNQSARELLLAQSSNWAFIITTGTMVEYAKKRTNYHLRNFTNLYSQIINKSLDESYLKILEKKNNIFPEIDYKVYL
jgi:1,4-alpha-glucan branching enzyme